MLFKRLPIVPPTQGHSKSFIQTPLEGPFKKLVLPPKVTCKEVGMFLKRHACPCSAHWEKEGGVDGKGGGGSPHLPFPRICFLFTNNNLVFLYLFCFLILWDLWPLVYYGDLIPIMETSFLYCLKVLVNLLADPLGKGKIWWYHMIKVYLYLSCQCKCQLYLLPSPLLMRVNAIVFISYFTLHRVPG